MQAENKYPQAITCHACGAVDTARHSRKSRTKPCAYCGARRRSKHSEALIDRILFGR